MSPVERLHSLTRDGRRVGYRRWFLPSVALSVAVHVLVLLCFVAPVDRVAAERPDELVVIEERIPVPPPPREVARPAEPVLAEAEVDVEITIPVTPLVPSTPNPPDLPEMVPDEDGFRFVPRTVEPRCRENCTAESIMEHIPGTLRRTGLSCKLVIGLRIDTSGSVTATEILSSSGVASCDRAVESWARTSMWTTAYNRDEPVAVWVAQPIEVRTE